MNAWIAAARPKTLSAGAVPVFVGSALAWQWGSFNPLALFAALVGALAIQIATNFVNDAADHERGADTSERLGPPRMAAQGLLSPKALYTGALLVFTLAFLAGLYLVYVAGWPLLVIGIVSIICGAAYTAGPFPLAYLGLGDLFVFLFFGLVAVTGTYYVHTLSVNSLVVCIAVLVGLQGVSLIAINNTRDIPTDTKAGKQTLSLRLGDKGARLYTVYTVLLPFFLLPVLVWRFSLPNATLLPLVAFPLALFLARDVIRAQGRGFNPLLARAAKLQMIFGLLLSLGLCL